MHLPRKIFVRTFGEPLLERDFAKRRIRGNNLRGERRGRSENAQEKKK